MERNLREVFGQRDSDRRKVDKPLRVGIIGLSAERGWATAAHIPALHALSNHFELAGVANTSLASERAAAAAFGLPRAFESTAELVASPDVDVVVVNACELVADRGDDTCDGHAV